MHFECSVYSTDPPKICWNAAISHKLSKIMHKRTEGMERTADIVGYQRLSPDLTMKVWCLALLFLAAYAKAAPLQEDAEGMYIILYIFF